MQWIHFVNSFRSITFFHSLKELDMLDFKTAKDATVEPSMPILPNTDRWMNHNVTVVAMVT